MTETKFTTKVLILIAFLLRTHVFCQLSNTDNSTEKNSISISIISSPPPPEPNTPNSVIKSLSSVLQELGLNDPTQYPDPSTSPLTTPQAVAVSPNKLPTLLQEATDIPYTRGDRNRNRNRNRDRFRDNDRRNNRLFRGRNRNRNRDPNNPDKFLRRLMGFGSRFIARSLSLVTGDEVSESSENKFRQFENPEYYGAVGEVNNNSSSHEENSGEQSLNDKWRNLNPIQLLRNRFEIKNNKMMRWRQVKDNFRKKELDRRIDYFSDESGDVVTKNIRNTVRRLSNWYEKDTDTMQLWVDYRKQKLKRFLEIPLIASILGNKSPGAVEEVKPTTTSSPSLYDFPSTSLEEQQNGRESRRDNDYEDDNGRNDRQEPSPIFNPIAEISRKFRRFIRNLIA